LRQELIGQLLVLAAIFAMPGSANGEGGPPMMTDDPGTPGDGNWEINIAWTFEHSGSTTEHEAPLVDAAYGVGDRVQLKYEVPWIVADASGQGARGGLGNSNFGVKWRFIDAGDDGWRMSTFPQVIFRNPGSGSVERGLAEAGTTVLLPFEFERAFSVLAVNFDVGHVWHSQGAGEWFGGIAIGREMSERLELMAELHADATARMDRSALTINLGMRWTATERGRLIMSVGQDLHNHISGHEAAVGYVGWQLTY
jgi:hypothetical protein